MPRRAFKPALFFDFDNTLTDGDVLDQVIEAFSPNEEWREWEHEWEQGRLSAEECLRRQVENLRVSRETLLDYLQPVRIDPWFSAILDWALSRRIEVNIVSDSFLPLILHILQNNGIDGVPVYANNLDFSVERLLPSFPHAEPGCSRSANAKARHLLPYRNHCIVFAGDGRSDLDAALVADIRFAKDALAEELEMRGVSYKPFTTLAPVLDDLRQEFGRERQARPRIA